MLTSMYKAEATMGPPPSVFREAVEIELGQVECQSTLGLLLFQAARFCIAPGSVQPICCLPEIATCLTTCDGDVRPPKPNSDQVGT